MSSEAFGELGEGDLAVTVLVNSSEESEDVAFSGVDVVSLEEEVEGIKVNESGSVFVDDLEGIEMVVVVSHGEVFLQEFDLSEVVDFLIEDSGEGPFSLVGEAFESGDEV